MSQNEKPFNRAEHCRRIAAKGGKAVVDKYGPEYMSQIGKRGFERTTKLYFQSRAHHIGWLQEMGAWAYWRSTGIRMKYDFNGVPVWPEEKPLHPSLPGYVDF